MKRIMILTAALLALGAGVGTAELTPVNEYPHLMQPPAVTGTIAAVSDHHMVVNSDDGQAVSMAMDSRTLVPNDLATGMVARVEFRVLENGQYYATRIVPDRDWTSTGAEHASTSGRDQGEGMTAEPAAYGGNQTSSEYVATAAPSQEPAAGTTETTETLPQTASPQPLIALLAALALAAGAAVTVARRRRNA